MSSRHLFLNTLRSVWLARSPFLLFALKSALAAGLSWIITSYLLGGEAAALAIVSAIIVVQVTSWQTVRKSVERVLGVLIGMSLAVLVIHFLGLNFWTITLMIFFAQIIGLLLQNRGQYLATQIPISAALVLVLGASASSYPFLRLLGALSGGLIGIITSLLLSPPVYVSKTRDAVADLMIELAGTLSKLAAALTVDLSEVESQGIYGQVLKLEQHLHTTEQAYSLGLDSTRLNPWARHARLQLVDYPDILLALNRLVRQMRRIAYTINEPEPPWSKIVEDQEWTHDYAQILKEIASILIAVAGYLHASTTKQSSNLPDQDALSSHIESAQQRLQACQTQLVRDGKKIDTQTLNIAIALISPSYRMTIRGAILTDLRRMLAEMQEIVTITPYSSL